MLLLTWYRWYGHVLRTDDYWVKKCIEYEAEGPRPTGRPKRTWTEVAQKNCQTHKLNKEDAMDRSRWRKLIKDVWWSGWVNISSGTGHPGNPGQRVVKRLCMCNDIDHNNNDNNNYNPYKEGRAYHSLMTVTTSYNSYNRISTFKNILTTSLKTPGCPSTKHTFLFELWL